MSKKKLMAMIFLFLLPLFIIGCSGSEGNNNSMTSISGTVTVSDSTSLASGNFKTNKLAN